MNHVAALVPHPPIMVEAVGGSEAFKVRSSILAMKQLADNLALDEPHAFVIVSPHSPMHERSYVVKSGSNMMGDLAGFGAPLVRVELDVETTLRNKIVEEIKNAGLEVILSQSGQRENTLDHGIVVPMSFVLESIRKPAVCISTIWEYDQHVQLGKAIRKAADAAGMRIALIASGDLSHRLTPSAPAGFVEDAYMFDEAIQDIFSRGELMEIEMLSPELVDKAGECGLRSILTLTGFFENRDFTSEVLSYEGPFGVGYMVAYLKDNVSEASDG